MPQLTPLYLDTPATGFSPVFYDGRAMRAALGGTLQAGALDPNALKVTASTGLTVSVAPGMGMVQGTQINYQGLYGVELTSPALGSAAFEAGGIPAANVGAPRLDQIIARVFDHVADGLGALKWRLAVLPGTPTGGATLDNRNGAAALPANSLRLADVLVPAGASTLSAGNVRDRRPWARGALTQAVGVLNNPTNDGATLVDLYDIAMSIECSGAPLLLSFSATFQHSQPNQYIGVMATVDASSYINASYRAGVSPAAGMTFALAYEVLYVPTPGRHSFSTRWHTGAATATGSLDRRCMIVKELPRSVTPQN